MFSTVGSLSISVTGVSMWIRMSAEVKKEIQLEIAKVNAQDTSAEPKPDIQSFEYPIMSMNKQYAISELEFLSRHVPMRTWSRRT